MIPAVSSEPSSSVVLVMAAEDSSPGIAMAAPGAGAVVAVPFEQPTKKGPVTMSPMLEEMLVSEVVPRLRGATRSIPKTGCEDDEEIVQDATLMAARMMESAEKAGQKFTAGSIAFYTVRAARTGRRSHYSGASDVMSPGCQIQGKARHSCLDDDVEFETGEPGTLHDVIAPCGYHGEESDPAEEAARNLDWQAFLASHSNRHRIAIGVLVEGGTMREAGKRIGLKDSAALNLKRRIAADLIEYFGLDAIRRLLGGARPTWVSDLRSSRERHLSSSSTGFMSLAPAVC